MKMSASLTVKSNLYDAIKRNTDNSSNVIREHDKYFPEVPLPIRKPLTCTFKTSGPFQLHVKCQLFMGADWVCN